MSRTRLFTGAPRGFSEFYERMRELSRMRVRAHELAGDRGIGSLRDVECDGE